MDFNINNMKKIITLVLLMCTITLVKSQNNLVFNQTINLSLSVNQEITVPDGKTWKIEFANVNDPSGSNSFKIISPNTTGASTTNTVYISGNVLNAAHLIWLKAGSRLKAGSNSLFLSALEFNVVPTSSSVTSNSGFTGVSSHIDTYYFNEEILISPIDGGRLIDLNSITVPEGQMWKVIYAFRTRIDIGNDSDNPSEMSEDAVLIDDMLFKDERRNEFWLESGGHSVKFKSTAGNEKNKIVIRALIYDIN